MTEIERIRLQIAAQIFSRRIKDWSRDDLEVATRKTDKKFQCQADLEEEAEIAIKTADILQMKHSELLQGD